MFISRWVKIQFTKVFQLSFNFKIKLLKNMAFIQTFYTRFFVNVIYEFNSKPGVHTIDDRATSSQTEYLNNFTRENYAVNKQMTGSGVNNENEIFVNAISAWSAVQILLSFSQTQS